MAHPSFHRRAWLPAGLLLVVAMMAPTAQTHGVPEEFTAVAVQNDTLGSGAGTVLIRITRWSTETERMQLVNTLTTKGPDALLEALQETKPVGTIRTPDSLGYDLHYAHQVAGEDGGRRIVIATDRPIGFWEASNQPRTIQYPFSLIQMQLDREGKGQGTLSYATRVIVNDNQITLENYSSLPMTLTQIEAKPIAR